MPDEDQADALVRAFVDAIENSPGVPVKGGTVIVLNKGIRHTLAEARKYLGAQTGG